MKPKSKEVKPQDFVNKEWRNKYGDYRKILLTCETIVKPTVRIFVETDYGNGKQEANWKFESTDDARDFAYKLLAAASHAENNT